jgi:hypothetical protein
MRKMSGEMGEMKKRTFKRNEPKGKGKIDVGQNKCEQN